MRYASQVQGSRLPLSSFRGNPRQFRAGRLSARSRRRFRQKYQNCTLRSSRPPISDAGSAGSRRRVRSAPSDGARQPRLYRFFHSRRPAFPSRFSMSGRPKSTCRPLQKVRFFCRTAFLSHQTARAAARCPKVCRYSRSPRVPPDTSDLRSAALCRRLFPSPHHGEPPRQANRCRTSRNTSQPYAPAPPHTLQSVSSE